MKTIEQLLARALGANVKAGHAREIGGHDVDLTAEGEADPVLSAFDSRQRVFQWHEDAMELPDGAVHLATSGACEVQAFRFGKSAYGLQFHLEVNHSLIDRWLNRAGYQPMIEEMSATIDPERIRQQTNGSRSEGSAGICHRVKPATAGVPPASTRLAHAATTHDHPNSDVY